MIRSKVIGNSPHLLDSMRSRVGNLVERFFRRFLAIEAIQSQYSPVLNDQQLLAQAVVQFAGNAFALSLLGRNQLARESLLRCIGPMKLRDAGIASRTLLHR